MIRETRMTSRLMPVRKLYSMKGMRVVDFSVGDLSIFKVAIPSQNKSVSEPSDLQWLATEIMIGRRRIREGARRLARSIDELVENEESLERAIESFKLDDDERLVLLTNFSEDTSEDAEAVLTRLQGLKDARKAIEGSLAKARRNVRE